MGLDFTRVIESHPWHTRALTITYYFDHCQSFSRAVIAHCIFAVESAPSYRATPPLFSSCDARLRKAALQLQRETELDIWEGLDNKPSWSKSTRDDVVKEGGGVEPKTDWAKKSSCHHGAHQLTTARSGWPMAQRKKLGLRGKRHHQCGHVQFR